ncbi:uncharacterized protein LOC6738857 isoform X1 [Drosophila simulans]|uniref:Uncharacterized protein, isoform C n=1 Tax=Drosophila simulans TaxID=7240 RepID=A0A0J9RYY5_DROSI|nr:uncharacterized protein LOC6738857 isoform X1 [Drosophila simulans]KMZ00793.1 uncharacterized protein Dsimw501_GD14886, isoform C [Drosophila simulans]
MTCGKCRGHKERTVKCLIAALDTIKEHALMMQRDSEESARTIEQLKIHNEKLHKALDLLKERQASLVQAEKRRKLLPTKIKDDISPQPQSQNSLNMNIAISNIDLSDEEQEVEEDESITETETTVRSPRKLRLPSRKTDTRDLENVQPSNVSAMGNSWTRKTPKNQGVLTKLSLTHKNNSMHLKQTRLKFEANRTSTSEKEVIEESPNLSTSLKRSRPQRSLLQSQSCRTDNTSVSNADVSLTITSNSTVKTIEPSFQLDMDEFKLDSSEHQILPPPNTPPGLKISNTSDSVVLLTPATQDIIFVNDTLEDVSKLGTMDVLAEIMKDDDDTCSSALRLYEKVMINQQKQTLPNAPKVESVIPISKAVKMEPISQPEIDLGNESTKLPEDIEKYLMDIKDEDSRHSEEEFPRPLLIKEEPELTVKERFNIECVECEKFINFMGSNLTDAKIKDYLAKCRHEDARSSTPPGFWNPHMVSFAEGDPRNEVLIDTRFGTRD